MNVGNVVIMERPGAHTPVPAGTKGRVVAEKLDLGWEIEWDNGVSTVFPGNGDAITSRPPEGGGVCDFCNSPEPCWEHRTEDSVAATFTPDGLIEQRNVGSWAACEVCHRLIEAGKRDRLAYRAARRFAAETPGVRPDDVMPSVRDSHAMYWQGAVGPGIPDRP